MQECSLPIPPIDQDFFCRRWSGEGLISRLTREEMISRLVGEGMISRLMGEEMISRLVGEGMTLTHSSQCSTQQRSVNSNGVKNFSIFVRPATDRFDCIIHQMLGMEDIVVCTGIVLTVHCIVLSVHLQLHCTGTQLTTGDIRNLL